LLHEIGHATGAAHRLNREGITGGHRFGSEGYAKEELRAEMFSLFAAAQTGIPYDPERHAAYVQDWAKALKNDKNEIFRAAPKRARPWTMCWTRSRRCRSRRNARLRSMRRCARLSRPPLEQG
jgi:Antirestriction protein